MKGGEGHTRSQKETTRFRRSRSLHWEIRTLHFPNAAIDYRTSVIPLVPSVSASMASSR